ncbi:phosphotransferase [Streptomyces sp. NPDC058872]|uniref:phosphotransferase n=1 Tax=Streptomyces sp. NPDC058872 TaxID=3346661 RepID=UPI0036750CDE
MPFPQPGEGTTAVPPVEEGTAFAWVTAATSVDVAEPSSSCQSSGRWAQPFHQRGAALTSPGCRQFRMWGPLAIAQRWAVDTAREKLARVPEVERLLGGVPRTMVSQLVHGDLSGPNMLLRGEGVAALVDFHPPVRRGALW